MERRELIKVREEFEPQQNCDHVSSVFTKEKLFKFWPLKAQEDTGVPFH